MKLLIVILILISSVACAFGAAMEIVCGIYPGEIYFIGIHPNYGPFGGFYYSSDYGETIELRCSAQGYTFNALLPDAADSVLYRIGPYNGLHYLTTNGGYSWTNCGGGITGAYAAGVIPGEIYREHDLSDSMERSENYSFIYTPCSTFGGPDSTGIKSAAIGPDSGEVYLWGDHGKLFYSSDYGENFTFRGDLHTTWGINPHSVIINGAESGEVFIFHHEFQQVWRIWNFGENVELILNENLGLPWACSVAATSTAGELFFLAKERHLSAEIIRIYHTTNYFQDYTIYEHNVMQGVPDLRYNDNLPSGFDVQLWPNPANAGFNMSYDLKTVQNVKLDMYNILGQNVWKCDVGMQMPGNYRLHFDTEQLSSGMYFLQLQAEEEQVCRTIKIIK